MLRPWNAKAERRGRSQMSLIECEFAELHSPLFLAGTNLGQKLDPKKRTGLKVAYDRENNELVVDWQNKKAFVPSSTVASYVPGKITPLEPVKAKPHGPIVAQVSTPQDHVFAPGPGKTRA